VSKDAGGKLMESRYTWKNQLLIGLRNFAVVTGSVLLLLYLVVISGDAAKQELEELFVEEKRTVTHIDEPVVYGYEDGAKVWELRSEIAEQEKETESSELERIYELILFKGGEENIIIRGDHGDWDKPREKLILTGNVVVESADGSTLLYTEKLIWEERNKVLACPEDVDFWVEDNHFISNSLYSDDDMVTIDFVGDVIMFVVGLEGENFVTREGDFPIEDIESREDNDGMNVLAEYVHYDKGDRLCMCYPYIPLTVQSEHKIDEFGEPLPEESQYSLHSSEQISDPAYIEALQRSVAEMDLTPEEEAFLRGEVDTVDDEPVSMFGAPGITPLTNGPEVEDEPGTSEGTTPPQLTVDETGITGLDPDQPGLTNRISPDSGAPVPGGRTSPLGQGPESGTTVEPLGPDVTAPVSRIESTPLNLPVIPPGESENVLTEPDYRRITEWEISTDLRSERYEGDETFDPQEEIRDGLVFCYKDNKKFWCEELYIDMGEHRIEGLREVDARFRDLKDESREPPENRAAQSIQESPTQIIGNYMIHNWEENVTEGYGRVLMIQAEKDLEADNVVYYEDSDVVHAWGNVIVHQYSGEWWETSGAIEDIEDERAREDVRNPSLMTTDALLSYSNNVSWAFGNVVFKQEEQEITGERAQYEETNEILVMAGDVDYESEDGEKLSCALLTIDLKLEEYIAEGAAIARSILPEESRENLAEFRDDEETKPEDDARTRLLENRTAVGLGDWSFVIDNPPPPPIEVLEEARAEYEASELPGIESPPQISPGFESVGPDMFFGERTGESEEEMTIPPPEPVLLETNENVGVPLSAGEDEGIMAAPVGIETMVIEETEDESESETDGAETENTSDGENEPQL